MTVIPQQTVAASQSVAFAGLRVSSDLDVVHSYVNEEASAELAFGIAVKQGTLASDAKEFTVATELFAGIVTHSHAYAKDTELGSTGLKADVSLGLLQRGKIWVETEEAVTALSDNVRIRAVATGNEVAGAFRVTADDTDDCIDISQLARWVTLAGAGELIQLQVDLTNVALASADS